MHAECFRLGRTESTTKQDIKGAIISFAWYLKKNGYKDITIKVATNNLTILHGKGANIFGAHPKNLSEKTRQSKIATNTLPYFAPLETTMLYHQTKDILYVKQFLGHKRIESTLKYVQLKEALFDKDIDSFTCRVARTEEETKQLIEAGFEYVTTKDDLVYFRKRK